ncbi:MAG: hypothetical protein JST93_11240 [Acidobacteria bacterium]|nr:hypothetical protein [Acidobacteriota bacterium]
MKRRRFPWAARGRQFGKCGYYSAGLSDAGQRLRSHHLSGDEYEQITGTISAEVRLLPHKGILDALDKAMGRTRYSPWDQFTLLAHALDQPEVAQRIAAWVESPDVELQQAALQLIGQRKLVQFSEKLNPIRESGQGSVQPAAIAAAGQLRAPVNLPALLQLAARQDPALDYPLVMALRNYPHDARVFLQRVFHAARDAQHPAPGRGPPAGWKARSQLSIPRAVP